MLTIVCFGDLWINEVCVYFYDDWTLKYKNKTKVQMYLFGTNGLISCRMLQNIAQSLVDIVAIQSQYGPLLNPLMPNRHNYTYVSFFFKVQLLEKTNIDLVNP